MTGKVTGAGGVAVARPENRREGGGSTPTSALQKSQFGAKDLVVHPLSTRAARDICKRRHYLGSYPGGAVLNFGISVMNTLVGVEVLGVGPTNAYRFFDGADRHQVLCLARFWLDDRLGRNAESRTLSIIVRLLRRHQSSVRALVAYSDPSAGHTGIIYRAAGFLYLGESETTPLYRFADGSMHHSRTLGHRFGTRSLRHFESHGVHLEVVARERKLIYVALIDRDFRNRLTRPVQRYRAEAGPA